MVVTSGRFTEDAVKFASGCNVALVDAPGLQALLDQANARNFGDLRCLPQTSLYKSI